MLIYYINRSTNDVTRAARVPSIRHRARMVQYYEMYRMVVLLNPSTTIGTYGTDGNLWLRSVKPILPSVKHVGKHHKGPSIIWSNRTDGTNGNM